MARALRRAGFALDEGAKHTTIYHPGDASRYSTLPRHPRIKPHLLRAILKQLRVSEEQFLRLY